MMLRNLATNRTRMIVQAASLTAVGLFFFTAFVYALMHPQVDPAPYATYSELGWSMDYSSSPQP